MFALLSYHMIFITKSVGLGLVLDDLSLALGLYLGLSLSLGLSVGLQFFCHYIMRHYRKHVQTCLRN